MKFTILTLLASLVLVPLAARAQPANNYFTNRTRLATNSFATVTGSNVGANRETGEPSHAGNQGGASVWYRWVPRVSGPARIDTAGSSFDTLLAVYTGGGGQSPMATLVPVTANDDDIGFASRVYFPAVAGTVYQIAVDGYASGGPAATGSVQLNVKTLPALQLSSPVNNAVITNLGTITLTPALQVFTGTLSRVEYYQSNQLLGVSLAAPWTHDWVNPVSGVYNLTAIAVDFQDDRATSAPVRVVVNVTSPIVASNATWSYLVTDREPDPAWREWAFDDSGWSNGVAQLGYGDSDEATAIGFGPDPNNKYITTYFRHRFVLNQVQNVSNLVLRLLRDDGAIVYLNGLEVRRDLLPAGPVAYQTPATASVGGADEGTFFPGAIDPNHLRNGTNVLAVEIHQAGAQSSDVSFALELLAEAGTPSNRPPIVVLTSPLHGLVVDAPTNLTLTLNATDSDGLLAVAFLRDNELLAVTNTPPPFSLTLSNPAGGTFNFAAVAVDTTGLISTSAVATVTIIERTNATAPAVTGILPAPGSLVNLTVIQVTFSERVTGVDAADLRINGIGATNVTGAETVYVFEFAQPPAGPVAITWAPGHGITDLGEPPLPFDPTQPGHTWGYTLLDINPPFVAALNPPAFATVSNFTQLTVTFSEPVTGVNAADLVVNGTPAFAFTGGGDTYTFLFPPPVPGAVSVGFAGGHGITDVAGNSYFADSWIYTYQLPRIVLVPTNAVWQFRRGTNEASSPVAAWRGAPGFDDSSWQSLPGPFFYDVDGSPVRFVGNTELTEMRGNAPTNYLSIFTRRSFVITNRAALTNLELQVRVDDGYVAWLNGVEIGRLRVTGDPLFTTTSPNASEPLPYTVVASISVPDRLVEGTNVLAVQAFNANTGSSDFLLEVELSARFLDPGALAPRVAVVTPAPGIVVGLTNLTVAFSKDVTGVDAADLLVNGVPATGLTGSNTTYTFSFPQPAFGPVNITWAGGHGITDTTQPPVGFDAALPGNSFSYTVFNPDAPVVAAQVPAAGTTVNTLTAIQVTFSQNVTGVDAGDLLLNGVPATGLTGTGASYSFSFPQPAYGTIGVNWAAQHGIATSGQPANSFEPARPGATWSLVLIDQTPPVIALRQPAANAVVSNLTAITVAFSEPVTGVQAADLRINDVPATGLSTSQGTNYTFTFPVPNGTVITLGWAPNHGITDLAASPNPFNPASPGNTWQYSAADTVAPLLLSVSPPAASTVRALTELIVTFSEPVTGVGAGDLLINNLAATNVSGSGSGPYRFAFPQPATGPVEVFWNTGHGIRDLGSNSFAGGSWTYQLDPDALFEDRVMISEIMFHPSSHSTNDEWIELHNTDSSDVNLTAWQLARGVNFTFPPFTLPAGGFIVVAADPAAFRARYPGISNVLGGWQGQLSNGDESIELRNATGERIDSVSYADGGEWAIRRRGPAFGSFRGWEWWSEADGFGKSLELIAPGLPNQHGQNWRASLATDGTPGGTNSVHATNLPPMILDVAHFPLLPRSSDPVSVTARIVDEQPDGRIVTLNWRLDGAPGFVPVEMRDDGLSSDGAAGDGVHGAVIPAQAAGRIVEFYVAASDATGSTRTWPAPALDQNNSPLSQGASPNPLYQVDDQPLDTRFPQRRFVLKETERAQLAQMNVQNSSSDAEMNATFISVDKTGAQLRHLSTLRLRGAGSRGNNQGIPNYRAGVPPDRRWNGVTDFNLNSRYTHSQVAGAFIALKAGLPTEDVIPVVVTLNSTNLAAPGSRQFGVYAQQEVMNSDFAANHFPLDPNGNVYRISSGNHTGTLRYRATPQEFLNDGFTKTSNSSENDWTDLVNLTDQLNNVPDEGYAAAVNRVADVREWMDYFAIFTLTTSGETSLGIGIGDDYSMYRGFNDPRVRLVAHDLDTILNQGDTQPGASTSIWRATNAPGGTCNRFLKFPEFAPLYFEALQRHALGTFAATNLNPLLDEVQAGFPASADLASRIAAMKTFAAQRVTFVLGQIPSTLRFNSPGLPLFNGLYQADSNSVRLSGFAPVIPTRSVRVNGQPAAWTAWTGTWSSETPLQPGVNRVLIQALGSNDVEVARTALDVWYEPGGRTTLASPITANVTLLAANGPYAISSPLTVGNGGTLAIQAGTTVFFSPGAGITVTGTGRLLADGTEAARIRFLRSGSGTTTWSNLVFRSATQESRLVNVDLSGTRGPAAIMASNSVLFIDSCSFSNVTGSYLALDNSSFNVRRSVFAPLTNAPMIRGSNLPAAGQGLLVSNWFGTPTGLNDVVDFTGGQRPGAVLQVLANTFTGASDDILDLDGADAHIEGNLFLNVIHDPATDPNDLAAAIAGGRDGANPSRPVIVRNVFHNVAHAAVIRDGALFTLANNTIVRAGNAAVSFAEPGRATGAGAVLDGNIIQDSPLLFAGHTQSLVTVTLTRNVFGNTNRSGTGTLTLAAGSGNVIGDARLTATSNLTATTVLAGLTPLPGSPALGTGPNGLDRGALVPGGASLTGEPLSPTPSPSAMLTIAGPGITHYRHRVNNGAFTTGDIPVTTPLVLSNLSAGAYSVAVIGRSSAGVWQSTNSPTISRTWTVDPAAPRLRLNEVLADNLSAVGVGGTFPDIIELRNLTASTLDISGYRLTDDPLQPGRCVLPAGTVIAPNGLLVVYADRAAGRPGLFTGFGLDRGGDTLLLYNSVANGGALLDQVNFGPQLPNLSIGRNGSGEWVLTTPTPGATNVAAATGDPRRLRLNEWLAATSAQQPEDFLELYNPEPFPVALGGLFLNDDPTGWPRRHPIAPLSYVAASGYAVFVADGNPGAGPSHLNFGLDDQFGFLGLMNRDGSMIDCVLYGPQGPDVSEGRMPNGAAGQSFFGQPTPGGPNPFTGQGVGVVINEFIANNANVTELDGTAPDWVELFNRGTNAVDLADWSLSDNPADPRRYVFPAGTSIPALGYLRVRCDGGRPASDSNTGFGLRDTGGGIFLFDRPALGGSLLDGTNYGVQPSDLSLGRIPNGTGPFTLTAPTPGTANLALPLDAPSRLVINEWMANPAGGDDWFELFNPGPNPVALGGLHLTDDLTDRLRHQIPPLSFIGVNSNAFQRFWADGDVAAGAHHAGFSLRASGESIGLATTNGTLIDSVTFGAQESGVSEGRFPDGGGLVTVFPRTASPGEPNYLLLNNVVINEALSHSLPPFEDAIEVFNRSGAAVDLSGWWLSDTRSRLQKFQVPPGTVLPPGGFKVFYEADFNFDTNNPRAFALSGGRGDDLWLAAADTNGVLNGFRAHVDFGPQRPGVSFGRFVTSDGREHFVAQAARTFGQDDPGTVDQFRLGTGASNSYPLIDPVVISEIMYHPPDIGTNDNTTHEFIELRNVSNTPVPLFDPARPTNTWHLRNAVDFDFPPDTTLPAQGHLVIVGFDPAADPASLASFRSTHGIGPSVVILGPWSGKLDNSADTLELRRPDAPPTTGPEAGNPPYVLVEQVNYLDTTPWPAGGDGDGRSLARIDGSVFGNEPSNWVAATPSPGSTPAGATDTDGDGLPDAWETQYGFNPANPADAVQDADGDGLSNLQEFLACTHPREAASVLSLRVEPAGPATVTFRFDAAANCSYTIQGRASLDPADNWTTVQSVPTAATNRTVTLAVPLENTQRYFRVRTP